MRDQITEGVGDILGQILKRTQGFRGRGRLTQIWLNRCQQTQTRRVRRLPGGGRVLCDLSIPYEAMVWLEKEEQADLEILRRLLQPGGAVRGLRSQHRPVEPGGCKRGRRARERGRL